MNDRRSTNTLKPTPGVLTRKDDLEYGLRGIVRVLAKTGNKTGYFFERVVVVFNSEVDHEVSHEQTFLDHANLKIIIELPDPEDASLIETIRSNKNKEYTFGADHYKTMAALTLWEGLDGNLKDTIIESEKELEE